MPVVAAPLFGFSLGVLFAWAAAPELARSGGSATSRSLVVVLLFGALVYAPATGYVYAFFPDWSYAYLLDSEKQPVALAMAVVLVNAASAPCGFAFAARSAAARRTTTLARASAGPAFVAVILILVCLGRLRIYATYAQFHGDFGTEPASGSPVGWALLWMATVVSAAAAWTVHLLRRLAEPVDAD